MRDVIDLTIEHENLASRPRVGALSVPQDDDVTEIMVQQAGPNPVVERVRVAEPAIVVDDDIEITGLNRVAHPRRRWLRPRRRRRAAAPVFERRDVPLLVPDEAADGLGAWDYAAAPDSAVDGPRPLLRRSLRSRAHNGSWLYRIAGPFSGDLTSFLHIAFSQRQSPDEEVINRVLARSLEETTERQGPTMDTIKQPQKPKTTTPHFTRSLEGDKKFVCAMCDCELAAGQPGLDGERLELSRRVYFRHCGHVYCGSCVHELSTARSSRFKKCRAPDCARKAGRITFTELYI